MHCMQFALYLCVCVVGCLPLLLLLLLSKVCCFEIDRRIVRRTLLSKRTTSRACCGKLFCNAACLLIASAICTRFAPALARTCNIDIETRANSKTAVDTQSCGSRQSRRRRPIVLHCSLSCKLQKGERIGNLFLKNVLCALLSSNKQRHKHTNHEGSLCLISRERQTTALARAAIESSTQLSN